MVDDGSESIPSLIRHVARAPDIAPPLELAPGTIVGGAFRVERKLGRGGMGVVWLTRDERLGRPVAIKFRRAAGEQDVLLREARVMARLSHPNVVTVYEVGTYEAYVFLAMEYHPGGTLRQWLASGRTWREILDCFVDLGRGLVAAHAVGLIHADFKSDNVLIGDDGRPRVADFGLAHASDEAEDSAGAGTPRYMAPEVAEGGKNTARSDQYSFATALDEALDQRGAPRWLRGIVARGRQADPARRYPSIAAMLDAIRARRRRGRVALAATLLVALAAAASGTTWAVRAARPELCGGGDARLAGIWDPARRDAVGRALRNAGASEAAVERIVTGLDRYAVDWRRIHRDACVATRVRGDQSEAMLDARMSCLDIRRAHLGATSDLLVGVDRTSVLSAPSLLDELPEMHRCEELRFLAASSYREGTSRFAEDAVIALLARASTLSKVGREHETLELLRVAEPLAIAGAHPSLAGQVAYGLGRTDSLIGDGRLADVKLRRAIDIAARGGDDELLLRALAGLALELAARNRVSEAELLIALARSILGRHPPDPGLELTIDTADGTVLRESGQGEEAVARMRRALDTIEKLEGPESLRAGRAHLNLASALATAGTFGDASVALDRALEILERHLGPQNPELVSVITQRAEAKLHSGELDQAELDARRGLDLLARLGVQGGEDLADLLQLLSQILAARGQLDDAVKLMERAIAVDVDNVNANPVDRAELLGNAAIVFYSAGSLDRAYDLALESLARMEDAFGKQSPRVVNAHLIAGTLAREAGRLDDSEARLRTGLAIAERTLVADDPTRVNAQVELALTLLARGRAAAAVPLLEPAVAVLARPGMSPVNLAEARFALARALHGSGEDRKRARELAAAARDAYAGFGPGYEDKLRIVDAWLASPR